MRSHRLIVAVLSALLLTSTAFAKGGKPKDKGPPPSPPSFSGPPSFSVPPSFSGPGHPGPPSHAAGPPFNRPGPPFNPPGPPFNPPGPPFNPPGPPPWVVVSPECPKPDHKPNPGNNNGHGNNLDGVDSSNPGRSKDGQDTDPLVDDEAFEGYRWWEEGADEEYARRMEERRQREEKPEHPSWRRHFPR